MSLAMQRSNPLPIPDFFFWCQAPGPDASGAEHGSQDPEQLRARYRDAARELAALDEVAASEQGDGQDGEPSLQAEVGRQRREGLREAVHAAAAALEKAGLTVPELGGVEARKLPGQKGSRAKKVAEAELLDDDVFAEAAEVPATAAAGLVETERDRLIRLVRRGGRARGRGGGGQGNV